jgi:TolA-binding protein
MKPITIFSQLSLALLIATAFYACSSTSEKNSTEEFFEPVAWRVRQKKAPEPIVITRERSDDGVNKAIIDMLREQNKRLDEVTQQLNMLTKKELTYNYKGAENIDALLSARDRVSNEALLEMIREQNQQLNDVIEQLKYLSQNQPNNQNSVSSNHTNASPKRLDTSLNYRKAIQLYQRRQYKKASQAFQILLNRGIDLKLQDNCHFWMGVCYFNLKKVNQAIGEFTNALNTTGSDKIEGSYFMIGQCYEQVGAKNLAMKTFAKMLKDYPQGSLKKIAEKKIALLKKGGDPQERF